MMIELKNEIKSRGIQQKKIAENIGVSEALLSRKLNGKARFYVHEAVSLMKCLGIPVNGKNFERYFFAQREHSECTKR